MKFKQEEKLLEQLKNQIDCRSSSKNLVALDADGTIWSEDANDILLDYEMRNGLRDLEDLLDPYYQKEGNRHRLCEMFARRQAGWTVEELKFHCRKALEERALHVFPFQKVLWQYLKQKGMKIYIVTASLKWLVETAVELYDLPIDKVLAVETKLEGDRISSEIVRPTPVAKGKGEVFLKHSQGENCFIAGGNTFTDSPLLEMAEVPFVVHSSLPGDMVFSAEKKMKDLALRNGWILFERVS